LLFILKDIICNIGYGLLLSDVKALFLRAYNGRDWNLTQCSTGLCVYATHTHTNPTETKWQMATVWGNDFGEL